ANRRLPYGRRRLLLSLIFSSFPCFSKNLSLILEVFLSRLIYYLAPAFSKIIYAGALFIYLSSPNAANYFLTTKH
ncbi:hypothetical protein, partial [Phascolarctobacterium succinatutens]|uniref:hypothetical protein n=1 Tax=Phascolarctobacterium succinatutens TaxID=626940 RepID=UPI003AF4E5A1